MRIFLAIILISFSFTSYTQIKDSDFDPSNDSISIYIEVSGHHLQGIFYNFRLSNNNNLDVKQGYINPFTDSSHFVEIKPSKNFREVWSELIYNGILHLPDQSDADLFIELDGKKYKLDQEARNSMVENLNNQYFHIKVTTDNKIREYGFFYLENLAKYKDERKFYMKDNDKRLAIAETIINHLDFSTLIKSYYVGIKKDN